MQSVLPPPALRLAAARQRRCRWGVALQLRQQVTYPKNYAGEPERHGKEEEDHEQALLPGRGGLELGIQLCCPLLPALPHPGTHHCCGCDAVVQGVSTLHGSRRLHLPVCNAGPPRAGAVGRQWRELSGCSLSRQGWESSLATLLTLSTCQLELAVGGWGGGGTSPRNRRCKQYAIGGRKSARSARSPKWTQQSGPLVMMPTCSDCPTPCGWLDTMLTIPTRYNCFDRISHA